MFIIRGDKFDELFMTNPVLFREQQWTSDRMDKWVVVVWFGAPLHLLTKVIYEYLWEAVMSGHWLNWSDKGRSWETHPKICKFISRENNFYYICLQINQGKCLVFELGLEKRFILDYFVLRSEFCFWLGCQHKPINHLLGLSDFGESNHLVNSFGSKEMLTSWLMG